ncbi:MAG: hypothetical protein MJH10_11870 [Epibacterium sp.]|nr:hypothetical protein [Epibacterium sp.]NQX74244.1 hypothetical protein [Epibacterium sp.]
MGVLTEAYSNETDAFFEQWLRRTVAIMEGRIRDMGIGDTDDLRDSLAHEMRRLSTGYLEGEISFLERGRFVDMGSGRGYSFGKSHRTDLHAQGREAKGRKPKKWYGRVFYGRLNDLQGAVGLKLMDAVTEGFRGISDER